MASLAFHEQEPVSLYLGDLEVLELVSNELQEIRICKHPQLGKVLIINNEIQHVELWIPYYHESIVHIPMMFIKSPKTVLILGGGDLYAAYEVLKYSSIERVVLCDYDADVINLTRKYYEHAQTVLSDPRFEVVIMDARDYIKTCTSDFDLIIDDCFNLVGDLVSEDIFSQLKSLLSPLGICSSLVYRHIFDRETNQKTWKRLIQKEKTVLSLVAVPEYPGILHLLTIWGNSRYLSQNLHKSVNLEHNSVSTKCQLFNSEFCHFYLYLPNYIRRLES